MESSPSTPAPATPGTAKLRPGTDARISTGATDKMRSTASSTVSSRATTASSAMPSTADPSKRPLSRSNKNKSSAPPSATSTTRTRSPSTKPRISLLPNLGSKKKKSKKKKKKKPIIEDPKLVRDMLAFAESNNVQALRHILDSDEYDKRYDLMNTAGETLVVAAMKGHIDVMELLCEHLPSIVNVNGGRPLQRAALAGQLEACEYLLSHGADHNLKATFTDWSCLHYAVQSGSVEVVRCLIQQGAKIDATLHYEHSGLHNGWAPIHFAADLGFYDIIQCLIESHAQIDLQTTDGETALSIAAEHGRWDCVQWMVACGANIHAVRRGLSVVQWAIYRGAEQAVQFLVSYGAQPDLNVKVLWFPGDVTLHQLIKSEFSEAVYDQIDLAIYRGSLQVRERQIKRKLLSEVSWVHTPVYDPYSFDPLPPPTIRTFPESIVNLISAYEM